MVAIAITNRYTDGFDLAWTPAGGETTFDVELNREADFASDTSLLFQGHSTADTAWRGLPSGTPFWARARKTNGGNGAWSTPVNFATLPVAPAAYSGFSMDKAGLVVPAAIQNLALAGSVPAVAGYPLTNMLRDDPQSMWLIRRTTPLSNAVAIEFETSGEPIDTIAMLGTFADDAAQWTVSHAQTAADRTNGTGTSVAAFADQPFRASVSIGRRRSYHAMRTFDSTTDRYWRIFLRNINSRVFIARQLIVGAMRMSVNASRGFGSAPLDFGGVSRNRFGTPDRLIGWRGRVLDLELSWLNESEYQTKWSDLDTLVGLSKPVLVIQNAKRNVWMQDRMGFGELSQMRGEIQRGDRWLKRMECKSIY